MISPALSSRIRSGGQNATAIYVARQLYGCSLGEAKQVVDSLHENHGNKVPQ